MPSPFSVRVMGAMLIALALPVSTAAAQVMPPVFRPLAPEAIALLRIQQDSLAQVVADVTRRSLQMQENIQRLNQGEAVIGTSGRRRRKPTHGSPGSGRTVLARLRRSAGCRSSSSSCEPRRARGRPRR